MDGGELEGLFLNTTSQKNGPQAGRLNVAI
jgi:hypothetical protein